MPSDKHHTTAKPVMANVPCSCGEKIAVPLDAVLQQRSIVCWNCGAKLTLGDEVRQQDLAALQKLTDKLQKIRDGGE